MQSADKIQQVPLYSIKPDPATGSKHFRVYHLRGNLPDYTDLLVPHRKDHYLIALVRKGGSRQWVDMNSRVLRDNTVYFTGLNQVIVKEGFEQLWSTGIAFTPEFLSFQDNAFLRDLPIIQNPQNVFELQLNESDLLFIEDLIQKIDNENMQPGDWQQRMLTAHLTVLLTYLSRLYTEQYPMTGPSEEQLLLKKFLAKINENFLDKREVNDYALLLHISPGHLGEVVKLQSGRPAIKHIHERLILEARRLLFHTSNSLKEIADELHFSDPSYFNRFFKRETGMTPVEYRNNIRKMYH